MHRGLLIWNIALTVLLVVGFSGVFLVQNDLRNLTDEKISIVSQSLGEMNEVVNKHAQVISQHAKVINQHTKLMDEAYLAAIEANQADMAKLIREYQQLVNENASYFEDMHQRLENLSIVITH